MEPVQKPLLLVAAKQQLLIAVANVEIRSVGMVYPSVPGNGRPVSGSTTGTDICPAHSSAVGSRYDWAVDEDLSFVAVQANMKNNLFLIIGPPMLAPY